jgi:very-short-patch-repair endonuclease
LKRPPGLEALERQRSLRAFGTEAEKRLWGCLRGRRLEGCKFRRQVWLGSYIADFVCLERKLIVEADGGQHADQSEYDDRRTAFLEGEGFRVVRFWNNDVMTNLEGVVDVIRGMLVGYRPSPSHATHGPLPLPCRERE